MPAALVDCYRRWFDYEQDAHRRVLASLATVPEERRTCPAFAKAVVLLGHLAAARLLWLYRFGVATEPPTDFFPQGLSVAEVTTRLGQAQEAWTTYFKKLDDAELARAFEYQSLDGGRFRNTVQDILTQLFGHSWYHRGQIASLIREAGGEPAATDFVFWC